MASTKVRLVLAGIVVASLLAAAAAVSPGVTDPPADRVAADQLVQPGSDSNPYLWPYTSKRESVASRTLALNLVVLADADVTRELLADAAGWQRIDATNRSERAAVSPEGLVWQPAHGSARYSYVASTRSTDGSWILPSFQLATGPYLGVRTHVRGYDGGNWTALQVHREYWDWFRLRHTVTGVREPGNNLEDRLRDHPRINATRTIETGLYGGGSDGELVVVELAALLLLVAPLSRVGRGIRSRSRAGIVLPLSVGGLYLGVRAAGIALETGLSFLPPKVIAAPLYLVLVAGIPLAAYRTADTLSPGPAFLLAAVSLGAAFVIDGIVLGLTAVPQRLVLHRLALLVVLGLLAAAGASRNARRPLFVGVAGWILGLTLPLLGHV